MPRWMEFATYAVIIWVCTATDAVPYLLGVGIAALVITLMAKDLFHGRPVPMPEEHVPTRWDDD
jgi:hypothetical protein